MIRELREPRDYPKLIFSLSFLSLIAGLIYAMGIVISLPVSVALLALVFIYENPKKRFISYIIPIATLALGFIVNGVYALSYLFVPMLALTLVLSYRFSLTKAECSFYMTIIGFLALVFAIYSETARLISSFSFSDVTSHLNSTYSVMRDEIAKFMYESTSSTVSGELVRAMSLDDAYAMVDSVADIGVAILAVLAFIASGIAIKIFVSTLLNKSKYGILKSFAHFIPSPIAAFAYIATAVLSLFFINKSIISLSLANAEVILMAVFLYVGYNYLKTLDKISNRRSSLLLFIVVGYLLLGRIALQVVSIFGVWLVISLFPKFKTK